MSSTLEFRTELRRQFFFLQNRSKSIIKKGGQTLVIEMCQMRTIEIRAML